MTAILREDPLDLTAVRPDAPPALARIVRHCLEKSPGDRFESARDVAFALDALSGAARPTAAGSPRSGEPPAARTGPSRGLFAALAVSVALGLGLAWYFGWFARQAGGGTTLVLGSASQLTTDDGLEIHPAISPDGRLIAYAAGTARRMRVFIRPVAGGRTITLSEGSACVLGNLQWSAPGTAFGNLAPSAIAVVPAGGRAAGMSLFRPWRMDRRAKSRRRRDRKAIPAGHRTGTPSRSSTCCRETSWPSGETRRAGGCRPFSFASRSAP